MRRMSHAIFIIIEAVFKFEEEEGLGELTVSQSTLVVRWNEISSISPHSSPSLFSVL